MLNKLISKKTNPLTAGIAISLEELLALRSQVSAGARYVKNAPQALLMGQNLAKIPGQGIAFHGTREYQPGDDIRRMAWRVTARSVKPHVKIYHEEKERPIWLGVDLSPSLYFGTRAMFKSVSSIKQAALLGWSYLSKRERIGAVIATPNETLVFKPKSTETAFLSILKVLAACSAKKPAYTEADCLHHLLTTMQQQVRPGQVIYLLSDFLHFDEDSKKLIKYLAKLNVVQLIFVYDPFEAGPPPAYCYHVSDGEEVVLFNMEKTQNREAYLQQFKSKLNNLIEFARSHSMPLQMICTHQEQQEIAKPWMQD